LLLRGRPEVERSDAYDHYLDRLSHYDPTLQVTPEIVRVLFERGEPA
jgi:hypothetical protein